MYVLNIHYHIYIVSQYNVIYTHTKITQYQITGFMGVYNIYNIYSRVYVIKDTHFELVHWRLLHQHIDFLLQHSLYVYNIYLTFEILWTCWRDQSSALKLPNHLTSTIGLPNQRDDLLRGNAKALTARHAAESRRQALVPKEADAYLRFKVLNGWPKCLKRLRGKM